MKQITIYFDGAASNNGREGQKAGCAFVVLEDNEIVATFYRHIGNVTNNVAEWYALIDALYYIHSYLDKYPKTTVLLLGDSKLVVNQINGIWKIKNNAFKKLYNLAKQLLEEIKHNVIIDWCPSKKNLADKYAKRIAKLKVR